MSANKSLKYTLIVGALGITTFFVSQRWFKDTPLDGVLVAPTQVGDIGHQEQPDAVVSMAETSQDSAQAAVASAEAGHAHGAHENCASCQQGHAAGPAYSSLGATVPANDAVFKQIAERRAIAVPLQAFSALRGSSIGDSLSLPIGARTFSGEVALVREGERSATYGVQLPEGQIHVSVSRNGIFNAHVFLNGDARAIRIESGQPIDWEAEGVLIASEVSVSDAFCAPDGATFPVVGQQSSGLGLPATEGTGLPPLQNPSPAIALDSAPGREHVMYLDFDGETVVDTNWNFFTGVAQIVAPAHPQANNDAWVETVWKRVVEDFVPFNLTVTTDRSVFDAADEDQRLHVIISPGAAADVAPGTGGVAFLNSYQNGGSPIVWVFNAQEYVCSSTISHEAGHAFGLSHDGPGPGLGDEYYGGHNGTYTPGWAPIMGAWFNDQFSLVVDEVDQWSAGEYAIADNQEDDLAIISSAANGFGYVPDDYANTPADTLLGFGSLTVDALNQVSGSGVISTTQDMDVFQFVTTGGVTDLLVSPIDVDSTQNELGSFTQGANLAVDVTIMNADGVPVATGVPAGPVNLASQISVDLDAGSYFMVIDGGGRGADASTGFTDYASQGQYSISGFLAVPALVVRGGDKQDVEVVPGSTATQSDNGTDFGFALTSDSASAHVNTFHLSNRSSSTITNLTVSLEDGTNFSILEPNGPISIVPGQIKTMRVAFDPVSLGNIRDKLIINYVEDEPEVFEVAIAGTGARFNEEDNYEDTNFPEPYSDGYDLSGQENVRLSDQLGLGWMSDAIDWYKVNVDQADELIEVTMWHDPAAGPLTLRLHNRFGQAINGAVIAATEPRVRLDFRIPPLATSREFYISVQPTTPPAPKNTYDLKWEAFPLVIDGEDLYEFNNTLSTAYVLPVDDDPDNPQRYRTRLSEFRGRGIQNDEDWFSITIPEDPFIRMIYVSAEFEHAEGDINIEVIRPNNFVFEEAGNLVSETENDREVISYTEEIFLPFFGQIQSVSPATFWAIGLDVQDAGTYYIRVYGDNAGNAYDLVVDMPRDDQYERLDPDSVSNLTENDSRENAYPLGDSVVDAWLSSVNGIGVPAGYAASASQRNFNMLGDQDWFEFDVPVNGAPEMLIDVESYFGFFDGTNSFRVEDFNGQDVGDYSDLVNGTGTIRVANPSGSRFYLRVIPQTAFDLLSGYDFRVRLNNGPAIIDGATEDNYEENDSFEAPFSLADNEGLWLASVDGYGAMFDPDWYSINIPEGATDLVVECVFDSSLGNIDMHFADSRGVVGLTSTGTGDTERITWADPNAGTFLVLVYGDFNGNPYNIRWSYTLSEDNYEENDDRLSAEDLRSYERILLNKVDGVGIQNDEDWYRIAVSPGQAELQVRATFNHGQGDIDMELYDATGNLLAPRGTSSNDNEEITLPNPAAGDYYVRLYFSDTGNEYDFWWAEFTQDELDAIAEDAYEQNDSRGAAYVMPSDQIRLSEIDGVATQTDDDWYEIEIGNDNLGLQVDITFTHSDGDIDVEIYDSLNTVIARSVSLTDNEFIDYNAPLLAGTYWIRVYGSNVGNAYDLYWLDRREDAFEQNDVFANAYNLIDVGGDQLSPLSDVDVATLGDDDWYFFTLPDNGLDIYLSVELTYAHRNGNIDMSLFDEAEQLIATSATTEDTESLFEKIASGDTYIKAFGDNAYNDYDITWQAFEDDSYEQNDSFAQAANIVSEEGTVIDAAQFDEDWYQVTVSNANEFLAVSVTFDGAQGDIDLELYDSSNTQLIPTTSSDLEDSASFNISVAPGNYYIRVLGENRNPAYQLLWGVLADDIYEQNDTFATANDGLSGSKGSPVSGLIQLDDDWYEVPVNAGEVTLTVDLAFTHANGNIDVEVYDAAQNLLGSASSGDDNESLISGTNPLGGAHYIRVLGSNIGNTYTLTWTTSVEDIYEGSGGNNTFDTASDALLSLKGQYISNANSFASLTDEDWYQVEVASGDSQLTATLAYSTTSAGDVFIELFEVVGGRERRIANSLTEVTSPALFPWTDKTSNPADSTSRNIGAENLSPGTYYIRIFGDLDGTPYDLIWNCSSEDGLEVTTGIGPDGPFRFENDLLDAAGETEDFGPTVLRNGLIDRELQFLGPLTHFDDEWYQIIHNDDDEQLVIQIDFEHDAGDIDMELYLDEGASGVNPIAVANSVTDDETITYTDPDTGLAEGVFYLRVFGTRGSSYNLRFNATSEDFYDDNDAPDGSDAYDLTSAPDDNQGGAVVSLASVPLSELRNGRIFVPDPDAIFNDEGDFGVQLDDDWFSVDMTGTESALVVNLAHGSNGVGNLDLEVWTEGADGLTLLATSDDGDGGESIAVLQPTAQTYYIRVTGDDFGTPYDLVWRTFLDDSFEENDALQDAYDFTANRGQLLSASETNGTGPIQQDVDFYRISIPEDQIEVIIDWRPAEFTRDLSIALLDSTGRVLLTETVAQIIDFNLAEAGLVRPGGDFFIRVDGGDFGNSYDFSWDYNNEDNYENLFLSNLSLNLLEPPFVANRQPPYVTTPVFRLNDLSNRGSGYAIQEGDDEFFITVPAWRLLREGNQNVLRPVAWHAQVMVEVFDFDRTQGNIEFEITDPISGRVVSSTSADVDNGRFSGREIATIPSHPEILDNPATPTSPTPSFTIRVFGDNAANSYDLRWSVSVDDGYEDNNFIDRYFNLTAGQDTLLSERAVDGDGIGDGHGTQLDDDWFMIVVSDGSTELRVENTYRKNDGDIDLELYRLVFANDDGSRRAPELVLDPPATIVEPAAPAANAADQEVVDSITLSNPTAGIYFVRVTGANRGNPYDLSWTDGVVDPAGDADYLDDVWSFEIPALLLATPYVNDDGDVFSNWAEFALGLNANEADAPRFAQQQEEIAGKDYYVFSFLRRKDAVTRGYRFTVQESEDMNFGSGKAVFVRTEDVGFEMERVFYRCSRPLDEQDKCFFRLVVSEPAP